MPAVDLTNVPYLPYTERIVLPNPAGTVRVVNYDPTKELDYQFYMDGNAVRVECPSPLVAAVADGAAEGTNYVTFPSLSMPGFAGGQLRYPPGSQPAAPGPTTQGVVPQGTQFVLSSAVASAEVVVFVTAGRR